MGHSLEAVAVVVVVAQEDMQVEVPMDHWQVQQWHQPLEHPRDPELDHLLHQTHLQGSGLVMCLDYPVVSEINSKLHLTTQTTTL